VLPCLEDDPHGAFSGGTLTTDSVATLATLRAMLDGFMSDLMARNDPATGGKLADNVVITFEGDTPKDPTDTNIWPDQVPGQSNWMYILGCGKLKTGWFGGIDRNGGVKGFDPATGAPTTTPDTTAQAQAAVAAVAYAITNGDKRRVGDFTQLNIDGIVV
jgi:type II secretory pathway pseudopilin PulG